MLGTERLAVASLVCLAILPLSWQAPTPLINYDSDTEQLQRRSPGGGSIVNGKLNPDKLKSKIDQYKANGDKTKFEKWQDRADAYNSTSAQTVDKVLNYYKEKGSPARTAQKSIWRSLHPNVNSALMKALNQLNPSQVFQLHTGRSLPQSKSRSFSGGKVVQGSSEKQ